MGYREDIRKEVEDIAHIPLMGADAPPKIDLYMEQVIAFLQEETAAWSRFRMDKCLTKTMINNYTKAEVLPHPVKKKYGKEHIYRLNYVYLFKQILSIQDIGTLFSLPETGEMESLYAGFTGLVDAYREQYIQGVMCRLDRVEQYARSHGITGLAPTLMLFISLMSLEAAVDQMVCQRLLARLRSGDRMPGTDSREKES